MAIYQELLNYNEVFSTLRHEPIIVNDLNTDSEADKEALKEAITSRYSTDMMSILPSCHCGCIKGEHALGVVCHVCHTPVKSIVGEDIEPLLWYRRPVGVAPLMNPAIFIMLTKRLAKSGFSVLHWLMDTTYRTDVKPPAVLEQLLQIGIKRGYNNFYDNFDFIIDTLFQMKDFNTKLKKQQDDLYILIKQERHKIFSDYIPLPNKSLLIIESTNVGKYIDPIIVKAVDAIQMVTSIDVSSDCTQRIKENRTLKALSKLCEFHISTYKDTLAPKPGLFRKHIYASRTNFSFRAVIVSRTGVHIYDEIEAPWGVGIAAFKPHLINKLLKRGYRLNEANGLLLGHIECYHPLIDELLNELINESNEHGITVIAQRNPSLLAGSAMTVRICKFKTDPTDHTVGLSILIVTPLNADFDGDEINFSIALDNKTARSWAPLAPHNNIFIANVPRQMSNALAIPKPVVATISNWISSGSPLDLEKQKRMVSLFQ